MTPQFFDGSSSDKQYLQAWLLNNTIVASGYHHRQSHVASPVQAGGQSSFFPLQDPSAAKQKKKIKEAWQADVHKLV